MPRFNIDPSKVSATIEVFEKGDYEFAIIGEPKTFMRKNRKGDDSFGVRYQLEIKSDGPANGKKLLVSCYQQSEGAQSMTKQFFMAVLGYQRKASEEQRFNNDFAGADWSFDTDSGMVGDMWRTIIGKRVACSLDVGISDSGEQQQVFKQWRAL